MSELKRKNEIFLLEYIDAVMSVIVTGSFLSIKRGKGQFVEAHHDLCWIFKWKRRHREIQSRSLIVFYGNDDFYGNVRQKNPKHEF